MANNDISAQKKVSPELISHESMKLMVRDGKTIKRLSFAAISGLIAYISATFATVLQIPTAARFEWLGVCIAAFLGSLAFLTLAGRTEKSL